MPAYILRSLNELKMEGKIEITEPNAKYKPRIFRSCQAADTSLFSDVEQSIVKAVAAQICDDFTATEISEITHDEVWHAAADGEEIPMEATLVSDSGDYPYTVTHWADTVVDAHAAV